MNKQTPIDRYAALTSDSSFESKNMLSTAFSKPLKFSTGGIRALIKHGFSFINDVTVNIVITSLINHLKTQDCNEKVYIGFDGRRNSSFFAFIAASIFKKFNYEVIMHNMPVITPFVAFMANEIGIGIMITASHNGCDYNGIKIFLEGGCQISSPVDKAVERFIEDSLFTNIDMMGHEFREDKNTVVDIDTLDFITKCSFEICLDKYSLDFCKNWPGSFITEKIRKILFSPLYGPGQVFFKNMIRLHDCADLVVFYEPHCVIDEHFGGIKYPNPENFDVFSDPIKFADSNNIDVIMITDPDGDRFALAEKVEDDGFQWHFYDVDEIALLLASLLTDMYKPDQIMLFNTFYCSNLIKEMAFRNGYGYKQTETGFKNISSLVRVAREEGKNGILAFEDSLGFLIGNSSEKDAIPCCLIITKLFQIELQAKKTCEEINKGYGNLFCIKKHIRVEEPEREIEEWIKKLKRNYAVKLKNKTFKVKCENFKLFLRTSGTESMIKIYAKSKGIKKELLRSDVEKLVNYLLKND